MSMKVPQRVNTPPSSAQSPPTLLSLLARRPVSQRQAVTTSRSRPSTAPPPPSPRLSTPRNRPATPLKKPQTARASVSPKQLNVVLPPRRFSSLSSSCLADSSTSVYHADIKIHSLHFSDSYTPHKEYWIRNALEKLGNSWVKEKKITYTELLSKAFEEKMGVLYELAMDKKHESIDRLVEEVQEEEIVKEKKKKKKKPSSAPPQEPVLQDNFPFAPQLSQGLKRTMSSLLLDIMKREQGQGEQKKSSPLKKKHDKMDESISSSLGSVGKSTQLTQCYVLDGQLVVGGKKLLAIGGSIVNQFADTAKSRVRSHPNGSSYFRKTANMMGFLAHEISIRYCKKGHRIIVSGSRPQRNEIENARQVREVVMIPKGTSIHGMLVMRTAKGSLIFEENPEQDAATQ